MRVDTTGDCWLWTGTTAYLRGGYGTFYDDDQRLRRAHRVSWELTHGPIPDGLVVCHDCDTPACVRPAHLSLGTQADNLAAMAARKRAHKTGERGEDRYNATLTEDLVREARRVRAEGGSVADLARSVGVHPETLRLAARGTTWRHVS